jgi:hypothetical protein
MKMAIKEKLRSLLEDIKEAFKNYSENMVYQRGWIPRFL